MESLSGSTWKYRLLAFFVLGILICCAGSLPVRGQQSTELTAKRALLQELSGQVDEAKQQLLSIKKQEKGVLAELENTEMRLEKVRSRLNSLERQIKDTEKSIAETEKGLAASEKELALAKERLEERLSVLKTRLRAMYMWGPGDYLEVLFSSSSFADFIGKYDYLRMIVESDVRCFNEIELEIQEISDQMAEVEKKKADLEKQRTKLISTKAEATEQESQLSREVKERESQLARIQEDRERYEKALDELEQVSRELERAIREQQAKDIREGKAIPRWTGKFVMPVQGRISSDFGMRYHPILKQNRFHSGIDIAVPTGTPVQAVADGIVIHSGWITGYGYTVIIDHGGGLSTLYGHNSSLVVKVGQSVIQGDLIARAGSTGMSTGPHVHFEVRDQGVPVNPWQWLK
ncbi:MAG: peptidoglycan DD-metalloendopeptidase family protein [Bacillota bacterium]|nr:peptidoglycan DD-metalloendopeptidase family protein [Bacillota bacterium]NLD11948.1 peptidoglycan DD-metalloendopeptidase family protein [Bacillota bacterium]HOB87950.1 peptidoglycan DD-metalloendopeptidase family protein [Bacillota bacterium]HOJ56959.1 peptidoglycan DD-metalloendopeptidase family protein [Bacillota bacterium]HOL01727.1 peptidoglycan DD-metalloendopeptidase family protein [Bacillota bacterium]